MEKRVFGTKLKSNEIHDLICELQYFATLFAAQAVT